MAAELRLNVALDLQYFKAQLPKLSQAAAGFQLPLKVKFDRASLNREIRNLQRSVRQKKVTIEINLAGGLSKKQFDEIQDRLDLLSRRKAVEIPVSIRAAATKSDVKSVVAALNRNIKSGPLEKGKIRIGTTIKPAITKADVKDFKREVKSKLEGIKVKVKAEAQVSQKGGFAASPAGAAGLFQYMESQGLSGGNPVDVGRRSRLRAQLGGQTKKQLQALAKEQGLKGYSSLNKDPLIDKLVRELNIDVAESILGNIENQMRNTGPRKIKRSFLDQIARAVMYMAGVDPAVLRQQAAARRLPPAVNFPASVPPRNISIGPSSTGRSLPAGPNIAALPGTSRFSAKYLPSDLGDELKRILRGAAYAFVDSLSQRVRHVRVSEMGQPRLAGARTAGFLPPGVGRTSAPYGGPAQVIGRMSREARVQQAYRRSDERAKRIAAEGPQGYLLPSQVSGPAGPTRPFAQPGPGGAIVPYQRPRNRSAGIARGLQGIQSGLGGVTAGPIAAIGKEFASATQQVLLFGTAYKGLAAVMSLPGNIANATAKLEAFRNQMEAVTGGGEVMSSSLQLIEDTVERFNIPIESARAGFVRLYASMQPAGIDLSTINNVFTGLSATASTFGMSADQVDRMTYALSQMASKGQIMTEELKGQLGDVFPQAVSLFAEAAGFLDSEMDEQAKGEGLAAFLKALEDGALKGNVMSQVLSNLGGLLNTKFAPSAEKAAGSFQNQMNKLNTALTTFYESFAPVAGAFLGEFVNPVVAALKVAEDAIKLAFSDDPLGNNELAAYLRNELFPQLENVKEGLVAAAQTLGVFGQAAAVVLRPLADLILGNQQFVKILMNGIVAGATFKLALVALRTTGIIPLIANIIKYNKVFRIFIAQTASGTTKLRAMKTTVAATGMSFQKAAVGVRILATAIRTVLVSSAIGIALVAIGALIEKIMHLKNVAEGIKAQEGQAGLRIRKAAERGGTEAMNQEVATVRGEIASRQRSINILETLQGGGVISEADKKQLEATGSLPTGLMPDRGGGYNAQVFIAGDTGAIGVHGSVDRNLTRNRESLANFTKGMDEDMVAAAKNAAVVDARFKSQSAIDLKGLGLDLDEDGNLKGGGKTPMTADELTIIEGINEKRREGNELAEAHLKFAQRLLEIRNSDADTTQKQADLDTARTDHALEIKEINEKAAKEKADALKQEKENRREVDQIMLDQQLATGDISQKEYDIKMQLLEQEAILRRMKELGATDGEIATARSNFANTPAPGSVDELARKAKDQLADLVDPMRQLDVIATGVGDTFATMFTDLATGASTAQEALGSMFDNLAGMFADMVQEIIAQWLKVQLIEGLGSIFGGMMGGGATTQQSAAQKAGWPTARPYANGGIAYGGFTPFANGGVVKGPTLGLVGEGRHNEAIVPLPNGKSIPVEMGKGMGGDVNSSVVVNINNSGNAQSSTKGSQGNQLAKGIEGAVKDVIMREMRPGGMIASRR